jgi:hypothetical protein
MKPIYILTIWLLSLFPYETAVAAQSIIPHQVGGFMLGRPIDIYKKQVKLESRMNVRYQEYLYEVEINPTKEFKSGLIAVSNCADSGKIVRIKLKFADDSKDFFEELLKRYKARFGPPTEYQGDPFHIFIVWKWRFIDVNQNQINLILQHNLQDEDEKIGNAVKMTLMNQVEKERNCFLEKERRTQKKILPFKKKKTSKLSTDWELLIPY